MSGAICWATAVRPQQEGVIRMAGFLFRLETKDGVPAEAPTLAGAVPNSHAGDTIPLGYKMLRVVAVRDEDADEPPVLIVEDMAGPGKSAAA